MFLKIGTVPIYKHTGVTVLFLVRYGSRSNTKKRNAKINGSARFALSNRKTKKRRGHGRAPGKKRYGSDTVTNSDPPTVYSFKLDLLFVEIVD